MIGGHRQVGTPLCSFHSSLNKFLQIQPDFARLCDSELVSVIQNDRVLGQKCCDQLRMFSEHQLRESKH